MDDLESHSDFYRLLVENSLGLMCVHDLTGVLLAINPAVAESLGYEPEAGLGRNLRDFLAPSLRQLFDHYLERIRQNGKDSGLMRLLAKDGTERIWLYRNTLFERPGLAAVVLGHALDITERVYAERALKEAQEALQEANRNLEVRVRERTAELQQTNARLRAEIEQREQAEEELLRARKLESLGVLAGGIAHDFNNFLTVVGGNIELARSKLKPADPVQEILEETMGACQRATFLASQLLTFAKGGTPIRRVVALSEIIVDAVSLARAGSPISFVLDIASNLRPAEVDAGQIGQVLHNVLLNARQAMADSGVIEVRAENAVHQGYGAERAKDYVRISVRDYGCGIPVQILPRIFDPYFTTKPGGSGLGLATAYAIVSKHQGAISVESHPGEGTLVTIDLPVCQAEPSLEPPVEKKLLTGSGKVLVMDDEAAVRRLLERVLISLGYEVQCAADGAEAIALYEAAKRSGRGFDAVLLDLTVRGGMGGIETASALRELDPSVRLIVSSGYSEGAVMSDPHQYGFDGVLPKPWTRAQLSEVFGRVLAKDPNAKRS